VAKQIDRALQQQPPEISRPRLGEQFVTGVEVDFLAHREQFAQLIIGQPVEQGDGTQSVDAHQLIIDQPIEQGHGTQPGNSRHPSPGELPTWSDRRPNGWSRSDPVGEARAAAAGDRWRSGRGRPVG